MEVKQIYDLTNKAFKETLGETAVLNEDLSNLIDLGIEIFNARATDNYVRALVDHIGQVIFVNRPYEGNVPKVLMTSSEYGSVIEKIQCEMPEATENETWELEDGVVYEQNQFYKPKVSVKFFNSKTTFEVPMSFTERQVKSALSSVSQLDSFLSMIITSVQNALTVRLNDLIMRTINNMTAETIYNEYQGTDVKLKSTVKAVNLLYLYNNSYSKQLTADQALVDKDFLKFMSATMGKYIDRMKSMTKLFNIGEKARFTPVNRLHFVMLSEVEKNTEVYLESDTFHNNFVSLPNHEVVSFWQGTGDDFSFKNTSKIDVKTASNNTVQISGVIAVMFDSYALGVTNIDRRVTTHYNAKAEFYSNWYKNDAGYFNDFNENFVVFFIA